MKTKQRNEADGGKEEMKMEINQMKKAGENKDNDEGSKKDK
jgi:hypothetical protein